MRLSFGEKKVLVLDVDGVLLNWQSRVHKFCDEKFLNTELADRICRTEEFINPFQMCEDPQAVLKQYNSSVHMENLEPYWDAVKFLKDVGAKYKIVLCTAMSENVDDIKLRVKNLEKAFGKNTFEDIYFCNAFESKKELYRQVVADHGEPVAFVDDKPENITDAIEVFKYADLFLMVRGLRKVVTPVVSDFFVINSLDNFQNYIDN